MPQNSDMPKITPAEVVQPVLNRAKERAEELLAVGCDKTPWNTADEEPASGYDTSDLAYEIPNASWSKQHHPSTLVANYRSYLKLWPRWLKPSSTYEHSVVLPAAA